MIQLQFGVCINQRNHREESKKITPKGCCISNDTAVFFYKNKKAYCFGLCYSLMQYAFYLTPEYDCYVSVCLLDGLQLLVSKKQTGSWLLPVTMCQPYMDK